MAAVNINLKADLQHAVRVQYLDGNMFSQDAAANTINIEVTDGGAPAEIGGTVSANVIRPDGGTVAVTGGTIDGNIVSITLPAACYALVGMITIVVKLTDESTVTTLAAAVAYVYQSSTDVTIDPGTIMPSIEDLIDAIDTAVASIPADYSSLWTSLAPAFSTSTAYTVGQYVTYNGGLYRFVKDHAAGSWVSGDVTACKVGPDIADLKSAADDFTEKFVGVVEISERNATVTKGKYLRTGNATVDISTYTSSSAWICYLIPCAAGDKFIVNAQGGGQPRAWAFIKQSSGTTYDVMEPKAGESVTVQDLRLTAPTGAEYLVINDKSGSISYKGSSRIESLESVSKKLTGGNCIDELSGTAFYRGKTYTTNGITFSWDNDYKKCKITGEASSTANYNIIYNSSKLPEYMQPGSTVYFLLNNYPSWLSLYVYFYGSATAETLYASKEIVVPSNATAAYIQLKVEQGTAIEEGGVVIDAPVISKEPSNSYLKQMATSGDVNNEIKLLIGGLNNGVPGTNTRRLYTKDLITVDSPMLVEVEEGWTIIPVYYNSEGVWVENGGDRDGPYEYVYKPTHYMRFMVLALVEGSHPVLTPGQINDAINHVHFYMGDALVKKYQGKMGFDWTSCSIFENFGVIGDSWASGSLHHPDGSGWTGNYQLSWPQILARQIGATAVNFTAGGNDCKMWLSNQTYGLPKLLATDPQQLYLINMGINDYNHIHSQTTLHPLELGTIDDVKEDYTQNPDTFYGCYGKIIGNILDHAPLAKIVLISVARKAERAMDEHIKAIADKLELPYMNLQEDIFFNSEYFFNGIYDGHPLSYIYGGMASSIQRLLVKCIMDNTGYFGTYYGVTETSDETPDE